MQKINCNFIGDFKLGDNINYNFSCLRVLYSSQDSMRMNNEDSSLFCKPITLIIVSIIEALLYDLFSRITNNTREGVRNIAEQVLNDVRSKTIDQLETYIAAARKHDLLGATGTDLYIKLDELRKVRNRVHIQNVKNNLNKMKSMFTPLQDNMMRRKY